MKRHIVKIVLFAALAFTASSCTDDLSVLPNDRLVVDNYYTTESDFRKGVDYAYDAFKAAGYYSGDNAQTIIPDILSDNLIQNPQGRRSNNSAFIFDIAANVGDVTSVYGAGYAVAARANAVLDKITNLSPGAFRTNIEAEARGIRAIAHFDIVRRYCKIPTQSADAPGSLGIAYVEKFDPFLVTSRDLNVSQVYDKIIADLLFAEQNITQTANVGKLTKAAVQGMLSRVYLYKGDYDNVILWGQKSLASSPSVGTIANFKNIWADSSSDGVLFKVLNSGIENVKTGSSYNQTVGGQIKSEYVVDYDLYTKFIATDIRKSSYIVTSPFTGKTYNNVIKYKQATGKPIEAVDIKYLRTAEVLLNVAEAMFKKGNEVGALGLLNTLRAQRYTGFVSGTETGTNLWNAIMLERRLELAFETDRFFTLKRLGLPIQRSSFGPESNGTGNPATVLTLPVSSHKWQLPIPQGAIDINPQIQQNPGY
ncbi:RagB/SusD family nutrient uptake outer membrane protein [Chryseobacterium sp. G0201]|uniref:RagB/SusD family nutrient uptake outer membrane protein n=1 Tax=Chryseobacterium sp. G0201 TaxID=2487065 RepID=UPI000F4D9D41|nr:RagB/SusD family nutrient uptake outer membrane protein [Chryseobacterium sp. G0201]AZA53061.1 RagB/SusD family nutrient uptake outer membrane protein [Chryseobacterium sp. G0201]